MRALLVVIVLLELALIVVFLEARGTRLRYALASRRQAVRTFTAENRRVMLDVAKARRPDQLTHRAAQFGMGLRVEEREPEPEPIAQPVRGSSQEASNGSRDRRRP
jgi:hypothetical protein